jgi:hypothetical protein
MSTALIGKYFLGVHALAVVAVSDMVGARPRDDEGPPPWLFFDDAEKRAKYQAWLDEPSPDDPTKPRVVLDTATLIAGLGTPVSQGAASAALLLLLVSPRLSKSARERRRFGAPASASSQRLRTVSAVPHLGKAPVPALRVSASRVSAAMRRRQDWREEQVVAPTGQRPLSWARWFGCCWPRGSSYIR